MKRLLAPSILLAFASALSASAANLTLSDGRIFHDAQIVSQSPRKVVIKHAEGLSGVDKTLLPAELAARYPVDETAAREAERQATEARVRAEAFHKAEAERAGRVRLEREQTALHNAQLAALEASERRAQAEATRIENQRTAVAYAYASPQSFSPFYSHSFRRSDDCDPRQSESYRDTRFANEYRRDHEGRRDLHAHPGHRGARPDIQHRETVSRSRHQPSASAHSQPKRTEDEPIRRARVAVVRP